MEIINHDVMGLIIWFVVEGEAKWIKLAMSSKEEQNLLDL